MDARPDVTTAPNGVRLRSHDLRGGVVRGEQDASYIVEEGSSGEPDEVLLEAGAIWLKADDGSGLAVSVGGFEVLVVAGTTVVDAGYSGDALVLAVSGETTISDAAGEDRVLHPGQVAVLGTDGAVGEVDEVSHEELEGDPWVVANRGLDAGGETDSMTTQPAEPGTGTVVEPAAPDPALLVAQVLAVLHRPGLHTADGHTADDDDMDTRDGGAEPPASYVAEPQAGDEDERRRRTFRVLEIVLLVVVVLVCAAIVYVYNKKDNPEAGPPSIGAPASVIAPSTTGEPRTTEPAESTSPNSTRPGVTRTTDAGTRPTTRPTAKVPVAALSTCTTQSGGSSLIASGSAEGGAPPSSAYQIVVAVVEGNSIFGATKIRVPVDADGGSVPFNVRIAVTGDISKAQCKVVEAEVL